MPIINRGAAAAAVVMLNLSNDSFQLSDFDDEDSSIMDSSKDNTSYSLIGDYRADGTPKRKRRFKMGDPLHSPTTPLNRIRNRIGKYANLPMVQTVNTALVLVNALVLGAMTLVRDYPVATQRLELCDFILLIIFTVENSTQLLYTGRYYFTNSWLIFDGTLITLSWAFNNSSLAVFRSFRIFRVFILVSKFESFRDLAEAMWKTLPRLNVISGFLFIFFYIFMVMFTNLYHELWDEGYLNYNYFGRLDKTFLTLFQFMTLTSWADVVREVVAVRPLSFFLFYTWICITSFIFLNLIVAVMCESLMEINKVKERRRRKKEWKKVLHRSTDSIHTTLDEDAQLAFLQKEIASNNLKLESMVIDIARRLPQSKELAALRKALAAQNRLFRSKLGVEPHGEHHKESTRESKRESTRESMRDSHHRSHLSDREMYLEEYGF